MAVRIEHGDSREVLRTLDEASIDACVTDPPYGLVSIVKRFGKPGSAPAKGDVYRRASAGFMGQTWDTGETAFDPAFWREVWRVLKPGAHVVAFGGTRTYHRLATAIEDAGFEIRDMIGWMYGCLDEATEVVTERGVMPYHKTKVGDRVLCYDVEHGEYTYQPILEIVEYDYCDTAYRLVGDFGEQVVSRNHRVIVERGGSEVFQIAETLECEARVPVLEDLPALRQAIHDAHQGTECPTQGVRAWRGHRSAVVRVVPFHYTGKVWCLRVPTGAFVAVRNGVAFPTGNSGFPKSHDVAKAIDKARVEDLEPTRVICRFVRAAMDARGVKSRHLTAHFGGCDPRLIDHWAARDTDSQPSLPTWEQWLTLKAVLSLPDDMDAEVWRLNGRKGQPGDTWRTAEIVGEYEGEPGGFGDHRFGFRDKKIRKLSETARQWEGWGTALKPAWEPIVLARKPLDGTVAANVLQHGTGALNIDGCRIPVADADDSRNAIGHDLGRWPANVIHDGSDEVTSAFPDAPGQQRPVDETFAPKRGTPVYGDYGPRTRHAPRGDSGSAARFFYAVKADADDRLGSRHPTVKPVDLMSYLCRLVTPPGGTVLDPFAGTGTTAVACMREGFDCILVEREAEYVADIKARLEALSPDGRPKAQIKARNVDPAKARGEDTPLFGGVDAD